MGVPLFLGGDILERFDVITRAKHQCVVLKSSTPPQQIRIAHSVTRHRGGPDACFHYKQYVRDNQKAINAFVDKRKKSRNTQSPNPKRQDRKPQPTKGNNPKQSSTPKENGKKGAKKFGNAHVMLSQLR